MPLTCTRNRPREPWLAASKRSAKLRRHVAELGLGDALAGGARWASSAPANKANADLPAP